MKETALPSAGFDDCRIEAMQDLIPESPPALSSSQSGQFKTPSRHGSDSTVNKSSGTSATSWPTGELSVVITKSVAPILERCESLNSKVDRTHAKLASGLRVNVSLLEKMAKDISEMKEAVKALTGSTAVLKAKELDQTFPLRTKAEVAKYVDDDPEATLAMER